MSTPSGAPLSYFVSSSQTSLEGFELARLNQAANLRKKIKVLELEERLTLIEAGIARWLINNRTELLRSVGAHLKRAPKRDESAA